MKCFRLSRFAIVNTAVPLPKSDFGGEETEHLLQLSYNGELSRRPVLLVGYIVDALEGHIIEDYESQ